jgi:NTP pyrophosphatase (non-canonical NTP hydrolase)
MSYIDKLNKKYSEMFGEIKCGCDLYADFCRCTNNNNFKNQGMTNLISKVAVWAREKGLIKEENSPKQFCKVAEEVGEVAAALARGDKEMLKDGIGDVVVTLIILAEQQGLNITECLDAAWQEIKDRKGKTVNGAFIKEEDLA